MDLKRAWRNGFLASVIFAIPLSDLYNNQHSNFIVDGGAKHERVHGAKSCGANASCDGFSDDSNDDIASRATSWDNSTDESGLTISGNTLADLLLESGEADFGDIQKTAIQFDPQDIFQSEQIGDGALD